MDHILKNIFREITMIYILGCSGMLGGYLIKEFPEATHLYRKDFDILKDNVEVLNLVNGDIIINAAGIIPQSGKTEYMKVNAEFPITLGDYCKKVGANMIHISTDCVFSGKKGFYTESDIPDSDTEYGISKALGDKAYATIIATSIIGEERFNKKSLLEWVLSKKGEEIDGYTNHIWNGVTCRQLCSILKEIIK
jgi:dTDP-4-dehydrorhamnose reductase